MTNARIVLTTVGASEVAEKLAELLVERRLAACVNIIGPIRSVYRWKGIVEHEQEYMLLIKTTAELTEKIGQVFIDLHTYELPERMDIAVVGGSPEYLAWLQGEVSP